MGGHTDPTQEYFKNTYGRFKLIHAAVHRKGKEIRAICGLKDAAWSDSGAYFWDTVNCPGCLLVMSRLALKRFKRYKKVRRWIEIDSKTEAKVKRKRGFWK